MMALDEGCQLQARLSVETRTTAYQVRTGNFPEAPITVYFTVRQFWGKQPFKTFVDSYHNQRRVLDELVDEFVVPNVIQPISRTIGAKRSWGPGAAKRDTTYGSFLRPDSDGIPISNSRVRRRRWDRGRILLKSTSMVPPVAHSAASRSMTAATALLILGGFALAVYAADTPCRRPASYNTTATCGRSWPTHCFACHGPDGRARKADLRLDSRTMASKPAPIARQAGRERVVAAICSTDADDVMPPASRTKKLTRRAEGDAPAVDRGGGRVPAALVVHPAASVRACRRRTAWPGRNPIDRFRAGRSWKPRD